VLKNYFEAWLPILISKILKKLPDKAFKEEFRNFIKINSHREQKEFQPSFPTNQTTQEMTIKIIMEHSTPFRQRDAG
jgi:hypothetical protein